MKNRRRPKTLLEFADWRTPPKLRALALARGQTITEITKKSGLTPRTFRRIAAMRSWANVSIKQYDAFCRGCGYDPFHDRDTARFIKRNLMKHRPFPRLHDWELRRLAEKVQMANAEPMPQVHAAY